MKTDISPTASRRPSAAIPLLLAGLLLTAPAGAQTTAPLPTPPAPAQAGANADKALEETIELSPFEVRAESDTSYGALNSNSITRFNTELNKMPVSADVFTEEFMRDVAATSVEQLLSDYGAGVGISSTSPDSDAGSNQPGDRLGNLQVGARGLAAGMIHRDGFTATGSFANPGATAVGVTSTFDTERAEVIRGPQGLLYGAGGAGGTINTVSKRASFNRQGGSMLFRVDQYGTKHGEFDYNWGKDWFAFRLSLLAEDLKYRRVFIGGKTQGLYSQLAFRLPFRTTLRLQAQATKNDRINSTSLGNLNFTNLATDPRHNYSLSYLLATGQAGATNPATGQPFPRGAVANGGLTWDNLNSWAGWRSAEWVDNSIYTINADSVWTKWLSTQFAVLYNDYKSDRIYSGIAGLSAPGFNGNPLPDWANGVTPQDVEQPTRRTAIRGSALLTNELFSGRVRSQSVVGYDLEWADAGPTDYRYYQADANWNIVYNPALNNLGRTPIGQQWWAVGSSPVKYPFQKPGWDSARITVGGVNYVRAEANPRDAAWVSANNPLGLGSLAGFSGVSGQNNKGHNQENRVSGYYVTNYTSWFHDRFGTLLGTRGNKTLKRNPNTDASVTVPYSENEKSNQSYNVGLNYALKSWLRVYYSLSNTYNTPIANANDPLGNEPKTSQGTGQEAGLKFSSTDGRLSGSVQYYWTDSKDEMFNAGTGVRDLINPNGLNGAHLGPAGAKNQWINLDRTTKGAEVILTASPTRNWRVRFTATTSDGQNLTDKSYPLLYNDQFYLTSAGNVTFQDGTPFLVPTDAATISARITGLNRQTDPATLQASGTWAQLTRTMINDPANPYWANPADNNGRLQTSNLRRVLQYFVSTGHGSALTDKTGLPLSDLQYAWSDPNNSGGKTVVARKGEKTVGYAQYRFNLTSTYTFTTDNWLRGVTVGGTVSGGYSNRSYYYNSPDGSRRLFQSPDLVQFNLITSYRRKLGRHTWTTQVNVTNLFNHYQVGLLPNNGSGFTNPQNIDATFYGQPRLWAWTNSFGF